METTAISIYCCKGNSKRMYTCMIYCSDYGTMVERKFKDAGLVTDLQPLGLRSMAELLDTITRHGVLYAAVVTLQHEVHRSITINILHGTPQGKVCFCIH